MHIAIDVNDSSIANKILDFLNDFKKEVTISTYKDDETFLKNRDSLQKIYKDINESNQTLQGIDDEFWDEMDSVIKNA
jgi:sugar-specific transcriptional regulator TrmB